MTMAMAMAPYAKRIQDKTRGRIQSYLQSKDHWNLSRSLKNLIEQTVRDYEHRAVLELLQNAHDAHGPTERCGRVLVRLDHSEGEHGVLYVANTGRGFTDSNFDAITDIAQSDKRPEEGIGNKGIGFKSVLQLSRSPEIYSVSANASPGEVSAGYCFRFATQPDLVDHLEQIGQFDTSADIASEVEQDVFHLCLPVALHERPTVVDTLAADGYVTVIRLPLKSEEARDEAAEQIRLLTQDPPALLFLRRIAQLVVDVHGDHALRTVLERTETHLGDLGGVTVATVTLGQTGTYLLADKTVPTAVFAEAIARSISGDHISAGWHDWDSEAHVEVALRVDAELDAGRLYTYLPMGDDAQAPIPAHVNAPFFAKLARVSLEESVPLNDMLLDQIAELSARLLLAAPKGSVQVPPTALVDLLTWNSPSHSRLQAAFARLGSEAAAANVVPLAARDHRWGSLSEAFVWDDSTREVITTAALTAHAGVPVVLADLSKQRTKRLDQAAQRLASRRLLPTDSDVAAWSERIGSALASQPFDAETWGRFYDELATTVRDRQVLLGRKILIDDDGKLRACNTKDADARTAVAFFSPRADSGDASTGPEADLRPPSQLRRRVFFVSQKITWNSRSGMVLAKRPGRRLLEDGLVHEYRATDLLPVIANALAGRPAPEMAADVLMWTYRFATSREEPPWREIHDMRLRVPVKGGGWIRADQAVLSMEWGGDDVSLLHDLLTRADEVSEELAGLRERLVVDPDEAPFRGHPVQPVREFLVRIGVRTGLSPDPIPRSTLRSDGRNFEGGYGLAPASLTPTTAAAWQAALGERRPSGLRPYTTYQSTTPLFRLPGQDDYEQFPSHLRMLYARLIAHGLSKWPEDTLSVTVRRYNDAADRFVVPTPVTAFLRQTAWTPITVPGERSKPTFVRPADAWSHFDDAPPFAIVIAPQVRRLLQATNLSQARARGLGIRNWDDPATAADRVRLLAALFEAGEVPETVLTNFRSAYEDAWIDAVTMTTGGTPLDSGERAPPVIARGTRLDIVDLRAGGVPDPVYVQDTDARKNVQLLEQCGAPVLRLRQAHAGRVASRLEHAFGARIRRVSTVTVTVRVDGDRFVPSAEAPLLVGTDREWFLDLVAAVIELRSGRFHRGGSAALRRSVARLRKVRVVLADHLDADIDGRAVTALSAGTRWLTVSHDENPTLILRRHADDDEARVLEHATAPIAELLGQPELGAAIRVALIDLAAVGYGVARPPDTAALAEALSEPAPRIQEIRLVIRRPEDIALDVLIPLVAVWDLTTARELEAGEDVPSTPVELAAWLAVRAGTQVEAGVLLAAAVDRDLDAARQALGIPLERLNAAIRELGGAHQELKDPERVTQQFRHFVAAHTAEILNELRHAYMGDYRAGQPLDRYLERRDLVSLLPDPAWVEHYLVVPDDLVRRHVNDWLVAAGAQPLGTSPPLQPIDTLRRDNRGLTLGWVGHAVDVARAYEKAHDLPTSGLPGDAVEIVDAATSAGLMDFEQITLGGLLEWLQHTRRWPAGMPITLDKASLGLAHDAVQRAEREREEARRQREDSRRRINIDGAELTAEEANYSLIVDAVRQGITEEFLKTSAEVHLTELPSTARRTPGPGRPGATAGRRSIQSDVQTAAIGLAGEVAALEWVKVHYPGVTDYESWRSGYRNQVLGGTEGDDTLGYDIVVDTDKNRLMFEVKATTGDLAEFVLTEVEIVRAQNLKRRERYHILFVSHVLERDLRRIQLLPNPLDPRYGRFYRTIGEGLRYRFNLAERQE